MPAERRPLRAAPGDLSPSQEAPAALALHCRCGDSGVGASRATSVPSQRLSRGVFRNRGRGSGWWRDWGWNQGRVVPRVGLPLSFPSWRTMPLACSTPCRVSHFCTH